MQVKTKHIMWVGIAVSVLMNGETLGARANLAATNTANRIQSEREANAMREQARAIVRLSKVALDRAKSCKPVVDEQTGLAKAFVEGARVTSTGGVRVPLTNRVVCNADGDTGYVDSTGRIQAGSIAPVAAEDKAKFDEIRKGVKQDGQ